ncbi:hypothetical protein FNW25_06905 [Flavobacterium franklandianum]|uniref:DUF6327 family protein n=1 Tax=Flavobacterium franklandianum TaxID=2594430 RepID=UPI00117BD997|nr:DUF6327 family protein [Flavobacterium franklandianum]TRX26983.1 hypothetical protein FNW25_06905 [Flavobacterium franklandianum]
METKKYSSYAQIELELEILKVERELNLKRIVLYVQKTKESLLPINLIKGFIGDYKSILSGYSGTILNIAIPLIINWITKRKRGD